MMKVLMLAPEFPWPLNRGSRIRIYHALKVLSLEHKVTLVCFNDLNDLNKNYQATAYLEDLGVQLYTAPLPKRPKSRVTIRSVISKYPYLAVKFYTPEMEKLIHQILSVNEFDVIWVHFAAMFRYLSRKMLRNSFVVLDQHNADELWWFSFTRNGPWSRRLFAWFNLWKERYFQKEILKMVDVVLCVSKEEAQFMQTRVAPGCEIWIAPNGVDIEFFQPSSYQKSEKADEKIILFCGSLDVMMNIDAVILFAERIFPLVRQTVPDAEFWIVGRDPDPCLRKLTRQQGVYLIGPVEDIRPYYERAKVFVAPFRFGAGTKLKLFEAMAMGLPIVATSIGCRGIDETLRNYCLIANSESDFAAKVTKCLLQDKQDNSVYREARMLIKEHYSWQAIFNQVLQKIVHRLNATS